MCLAMSTLEKFASRALFKALWSGRWAIHPEHKVMDLRWYETLYIYASEITSGCGCIGACGTC